MSVTLVMFTHSGERRDFKVQGKKATIGRNNECAIQIKLGVVSRRHCEVVVKEGKVKVRDLGSSNGTYVNNRRVKSAELQAGETLTVGPVIFTVVIDDMPAEIRPVRTFVGGKGKATSASSSVAALRKLEESGGIEMDDSSELDLIEEHEEEDEDNPLAELEELSKTHGKLKG